MEEDLIDCGVFLEVLLDQRRAGLCREAIELRSDHLMVSDFALHAIGIVLLRKNRHDLFKNFFDDLAPRLRVLSLPIENYDMLLDYHHRLKLDFDDAYQACTAVAHGLSLLTLDSDFLVARDEIEVKLVR